MKLRNGKIIENNKVDMSKVIEKIEKNISVQIEQKVNEKISQLETQLMKKMEEVIKKIITCECGKQCYLVFSGKCCKCSDKRHLEERDLVTYRGDDIYYHGDTWGYCPLCNDSKKTQKREYTCQGCIEDQPNQLAHMNPGGCLYRPSYYA